MPSLKFTRVASVPGNLEAETLYIVGGQDNRLSLIATGIDAGIVFDMENVRQEDIIAAITTATLTGVIFTDTEQVSAIDTFITAFGKLQAQVNTKAPLESPALTGTPTAPTAEPGDSTEVLANTAFVSGEIERRAVLHSDVGTNPNQVPVNQFLGKMAFMDVPGISAPFRNAPETNPGEIYRLWISDTETRLMFHGYDGVVRRLTTETWTV